ncbi:hypothetical protein [Methylobacterium sp. Leaf465]|uniref:hypothetical protein n=1 Tax=Methylobacterium sp. Leaf465 TaxID=1736385 RepID=UPI001FCD9A4A|nr:hypothetical protein [Methylobacterium sp. Leaf465]
MAGTFLTGAGFSGAFVSGALAAPVADQGPGKASVVAPTVTPVAAVTESEDESVNCSRSRKRLWVEGEGWIVRRVTTCR